jgi:cell division protein FtsB
MAYAVLHLEKASGADTGMSMHIERTISPTNADPLRTHLNKELIMFPERIASRSQAIQHRIENAGISRKISKTQVRAIRILLTGSPDQMKKIESTGRIENWCNDNIEWLNRTYGKDNIVSAVLHLDESTPHLHATIVPITTGERRKTKQEQSTTKKKYNKKSIGIVRLCADDIMTRIKLKEYQNSYSEAMHKYGLERGIDGSEAKHISTMQYYRELLSQTEGMQNKIGSLLHQQDQVTGELLKIKREIKTDKMKSVAVNVATSAMEGISSVFDGSKIKKQQREIDTLKAENSNLKNEVRQLNKRIDILKNKYKNTTDELREELRKIYDMVPSIRDLFVVEKLCRLAEFSEELTKKILAFKPVEFKGKIYSTQHYCRFETEHSIAKIENDKSDPSRLRLFIDNLEIHDWFNKKDRELDKSLGIDYKRKQGGDRGFEI